ncbi:MAG: serine hydrolase [Bacteroidetes bacterium]|nr:serine hydrolase [Bacteroidota bacterium]
MKKINLLLIAGIFLIGTTARSQQVPVILDAMLSQALDSMHTQLGNKSLSAAVQLSNSAVWTDAIGISSVQPPVAVTPTYVYGLGSVAKTMTAACILQLLDSAFIELDDSLYQYLDTFTHISPNVTIAQLLRHQSGLYDVFANTNLQPTLLGDPDSVWNSEDIITTFIKAPTGLPGGPWKYCNTNYILLGMIIESVTGNPYHVELKNRFFNYLGLASIGTSSHDTLAGPIAHAWIDLNGDQITDDAHWFFFPWLSLNSAAGAAGGYYGNAEDVTKWMRAYQRGELHSAGTLAQAQATINAPGLPCTYGLGLMNYDFTGIFGYGHGGDLGYSASSWYFPLYDISITVLNNDADFISWDLIPVVEALLLKYTEYINTVSIYESQTNTTAINVFPNPFNQTLTLATMFSQAADELRIDLYNASGQQMQTKTFSNITSGQNIFEMEEAIRLAAGFYTMHIYVDGQKVRVQKLVKQ